MKKHIETHITAALRQLNWSDLAEVNVSKTKNSEHGDYSSNIAMKLAQHLKLRPMEIARKIQQQINHPDITKVDVASPGFINFFTTEDYNQIIELILSGDKHFFKPDIGHGHQVYLELSQPIQLVRYMLDMVALRHMAQHLPIYYARNFNVHTEYYINDAGLQIDILTASLWIRCLELKTPSGCYNGDYLIDLSKESPWSFEKSAQLEKLLGQWNPEHEKELLQELVSLCKKTLNAQYTEVKHWIVSTITSQIKQDLASFGVEYNNWFHESSLVADGAVEKMISSLEANKYTYTQDSALWFKSSEFGDEKDRVLKRSNGIWTYFAIDLAYHHAKAQSGSWKIMNIFGADHHGYVPRIQAGLAALGHKDLNFSTRLIQFANLYRGEEKVPMSTRQGQFVTLENLYQEVGVDAARYFYCMRRSDQHLDFDLELAKSQNSQNPVYYIQYAYARIQSINEKHGQYIPSINHFQQPSDQEVELLALLSEYSAVLIKTAQTAMFIDGHNLHTSSLLPSTATTTIR